MNIIFYEISEINVTKIKGKIYYCITSSPEKKIVIFS